MLNVYFILEICAISKISKKEIGRCFKLILKHLETSVDLITSGDFMVSVQEHYNKNEILNTNLRQLSLINRII